MQDKKVEKGHEGFQANVYTTQKIKYESAAEKYYIIIDGMIRGGRDDSLIQMGVIRYLCGSDRNALIRYQIDVTDSTV